MMALNFQAPKHKKMLMERTKNCTVRLGDESDKFPEDSIVWITSGVRGEPKHKLYTAFIDKVRVKTMGTLTSADLGHHRRQIQRDDPLFRQGKRHSSFRDPLCQPFDDGGLTHPRFPDQAGVIFGAAGKDLQQPFGFLFPADDRVQPALPSLFGQIPAEAVQHDAAGLLLRPAHHTRGLPVAVLLALFQADGFPQGGRHRRYIDRKSA